MDTAAFLDRVAFLLRSRHPLLLIETADGDRGEALLRGVAERERLPFQAWSRTKGLRPPQQLAPDPDTVAPDAALVRVERHGLPGVWLFRDLGADLADPVVAGRLLDACRAYARLDGAVVVLGGLPDELPAPLRPVATPLVLPPPGPDELEEAVRRLYRELSERGPVEVELTAAELRRLLGALRGLTLAQAERALAEAMLRDGRLAADDLAGLIAAKRETLARGGLLRLHPRGPTLDDVAGLGRLKAWLATRRRIVHEPEAAARFGLPHPRGLLLVGVQGAGKSLVAKAVAGAWGLPLLELAPDALYGRYVGETEGNLRRALAQAEAAAPAVLWIDEIEKALATGGEADGGVGRRVLGRLLSWLQEREAPLFVVATANDIEGLPPELVRKGRFDEIFFLDLPPPAVREEILALHLRRRGRDPAGLELASVAAAAERFSGAELEAAVVAALARAFSEDRELAAEDLRAEIAATRPLAVVMGERLARLRRWAAGRTVPAHGPEPERSPAS